MANQDIFNPPETLTESGQILSDHMPNGRAWANKNIEGSNMNGLVKGTSKSIQLVLEKIYELSQEFDIKNSTSLLEDWEESVGIPDDCIEVADDLDKRRERIIQRLRKTPVVTLAELQDYVDSYFPDDSITLSAGTDTGTFEYEFEYEFIGEVNDKFIIIADVISGVSESESEFEYEFEYEFGGGPDTSTLECLLRKVIPANVVILINLVE